MLLKLAAAWPKEDGREDDASCAFVGALVNSPLIFVADSCSSGRGQSNKAASVPCSQTCKHVYQVDMELTVEESLRKAAQDLSTKACDTVQRITELSSLILNHQTGSM